MDYSTDEPKRAEVDAMSGPVVVEFGSNTCGFCMAAQPLISEALAGQEGVVRHIKIEDGKGRPLGRSYQVKLWPTLVFLRDGQEVDRVVRPENPDGMRAALGKITQAQI